MPAETPAEQPAAEAETEAEQEITRTCGWHSDPSVGRPVNAQR